jgi:hypothetical protein
VLGHGTARHLNLVNQEGIDALVADHGRGIPEEHLRVQLDSAKRAPQGGGALELSELLIPRPEGAGGEVFPADLAELQACRPDRPLKVGNLEVDHFMAPRLEPPPKGRERIEVPRRGETQDADAAHGSSLPGDPCARAIHLGTFSVIDHVLPNGLSSVLCHDLVLLFHSEGANKFHDLGFGQGLFGAWGIQPVRYLALLTVVTSVNSSSPSRPVHLVSDAGLLRADDHMVATSGERLLALSLTMKLKHS